MNLNIVRQWNIMYYEYYVAIKNNVINVYELVWKEAHNIL